MNEDRMTVSSIVGELITGRLERAGLYERPHESLSALDL
jgi:hypothetical protein